MYLICISNAHHSNIHVTAETSKPIAIRIWAVWGFVGPTTQQSYINVKCVIQPNMHIQNIYLLLKGRSCTRPLFSHIFDAHSASKVCCSKQHTDNKIMKNVFSQSSRMASGWWPSSLIARSVVCYFSLSPLLSLGLSFNLSLAPCSLWLWHLINKLVCG